MSSAVAVRDGGSDRDSALLTLRLPSCRQHVGEIAQAHASAEPRQDVCEVLHGIDVGQFAATEDAQSDGRPLTSSI